MSSKKSDNPICGVYEIRNIVNNKVYIGSSGDCDYRWKCHQWDLRGKKHPSKHMIFAWIKYGAENFKFTVLEECDAFVLIKREQHWMDLMQCSNRKFGYNTLPAAASHRGHRLSEKTKKKIGDVQRGKTIPPETRMAISLALKGKKKPPGFGEKISKRDAFFLKKDRMKWLLRWRALGLSCPQLAKIFGCDRHTVQRALKGNLMYTKNLVDPIPLHLKTDGRKKAGINQEQAVIVLRMKKEGLSASAISRKILCSRHAVLGVINRRTKSFDYEKLEALAA